MNLKNSAQSLATAAGVLLFCLGASTLAASAIQVDPAAQKSAAADIHPSHDTVLEPSDLQSILPPSVFFKGQSAPLQMRNAGGVHFTDGAYVFTSLVDTSGYSSGVQERYQAYFITETPLQFGEHRLSAGAYGVGFVANNKFLVMDIGGNDVFTVDSTRDEALRHPTPLKILQAPEASRYRLYVGRSFVSFSRAQ